MLAGQAITLPSPPGNALALVFMYFWLFRLYNASCAHVICFRQLLEELTELPVMVDLASDFLDRNTPVFRFCIYFDERKPKKDAQDKF